MDGKSIPAIHTFENSLPRKALISFTVHNPVTQAVSSSIEMTVFMNKDQEDNLVKDLNQLLQPLKRIPHDPDED